LPRDAKSWPVCSNSSSHQPAPTPSETRPDDTTAAVATDLATVNRSRAGATYTLVVNRSRWVRAAIAAMSTHGSGQWVDGSQYGFPSSE
jgi:hypothetical protein